MVAPPGSRPSRGSGTAAAGARASAGARQVGTAGWGLGVNVTSSCQLRWACGTCARLYSVAQPLPAEGGRTVEFNYAVESNCD
jgi:hypothetical protein